MITCIQIDEFKSFRKSAMEFSPLTVIAGANASGKSNLFDAIQLLSRVAEVDLKTAFSEQPGEAVELFTQYADNEWVKKYIPKSTLEYWRPKLSDDILNISV
ncbi:MAG TPA: AAA family ATPase [Saprospiraceae bacterium]|nr:AAA family ATPase [Saprospiraceae bacterium]HMP23458.1 AAA family ATPase [Saprospiraceae bacterium]